MTNDDPEAPSPTPPPPPPPGEGTPLLDASSAASAESSVIEDDAAAARDDELDRPWPEATFDRGMRLLAGPVLDARKADDYTRSPGVRARRYAKRNDLKRGYDTPEPPPGSSLLASSPPTPEWLKRGLVRMKSLDYAFGDRNTAIPTPQQGRLRKQRLDADAHAYRMKILGGVSHKGGRSSSAGRIAIEASSEGRGVTDATTSPGFGRERQMDRRREREREREGKASSAGTEGDDKSSFAQSVFNMSNILMGVGMLGLPYVFKSAGWIGGFGVTALFCLVTWRTAHCLGRELNGDPRPVGIFDGSATASAGGAAVRMRKPIDSFPAIAREAFGDRGCVVLSAVLYFELFSCLAIFFVSLGDHLHALFPGTAQSKQMTIVAGVLTVPSALLRTPRLLSYLSAVGTLATAAVVLAVVLSALAMLFAAGGAAAPPEDEREHKLYSAGGLPLALGIVAYCFSGHAIVPSIYQSMRKPQEFERMIDLTYGIVLLSSLLVAVSGYYMFGDDVEDQITISLERESENAGFLMQGLTWLMILTAISKFTLTMFPLALGFEEMLTGVLPSDLAMELVDSVVKVALIFLALAVAVFFPSFSFLCSLVGLVCTMIVSVIFPALAHLRLFGTRLSLSEKIVDWLLVAGGSMVAVVGTVATLKEDI